MKPPARRSIAASEFKARCLELMDEVNATRAELVITKHGNAVARLVPVDDSAASALGFLRGTVRNEPALLDSEVRISGDRERPATSASVVAGEAKVGSRVATRPGAVRKK